MNNFISALSNFFSSLFGGSKSSEPPPDDDLMLDDFDDTSAAPDIPPPSEQPATPPPVTPPLARAPQPESITARAEAEVLAAARERVTHALVLPDYDFRDWYNATTNYTNAFERVVILRSPAGNNLNRYKTVTAVAAPRVWFNDDPLFHIRRAYPAVVNVDIIEAQTPAELQAQLDERVRANRRFGDGGNVFSRFTLDWATDSFSLQILHVFDEDMGGGRRNEGIDLSADVGTIVRAPMSGTVASLVTVDNSVLGYGQYVQLRTLADDGRIYVVTVARLQNITLTRSQTVNEGDVIGECGSPEGVKIVVQQEGLSTGNRWTLPGVIDPLPLLYVDNMTLHTTSSSGLNIRRGQGEQFERVGSMDSNDVAYTLELHGITIRKLGTTERDNKWVNLDTERGVTGYGAAWFLQARSPYSRLPAVDTNGVNLDVLNRLGKPTPARLRNLTYARMVYNVSMGTGNQDLNKAFQTYAPYIDALVNADKKVILVYTHQTYGEGAGYVWPQMTSDQWRELSLRYADFVGQIARQFQGKIAAHQIWNEMDARGGAVASVPMSAPNYAVILSRAIQAIRASDPTTPIITGGHISGVGNGPAYARATLDALPRGVQPDGVAFHPYGRGPDPTSKYAIFGHIEDAVQAYYNVIPGKRVWITEWGVLNAPNEPAEAISDYATRFVNYLQQTHPDKVAATVWYAWADGMDNGYGLVGRDDQPKEPLYTRFTDIE